jgi:hypothetical protein
MNWIEKIGFFRLTLIPTALVIMAAALYYQIIGMGTVGLIILIFGILNKCILMGNCEIPTKPQKNINQIKM